MNIRHFILLLLCPLFLFAENLARNSDFVLALPEDARYPKNWYPASGYASLDPNTGIEHEVIPDGGKAAFRIVGQDYFQQNTCAVVPGRSYRFTCRIKTQNLPWRTTARFQVVWHDGKQIMLTEYRPEPDAPPQKMWIHKYHQIFGTVDWKEYVIDAFTAPEGAKFAIIRIGKVGDGGTCYFSNVTMEECAAADAFENRIATLPYGSLPDNGAVLDDFLVAGEDMPATFQTEIRACYDNQAIRINAVCQQPGVGNDQFDAKNTPGLDDSVEFFFFPKGATRQFHVLVNPAGQVLCISEDWLANKWPTDMITVNKPEVSAKVDVEGNRWLVQLTVPFSAIGCNMPEDGEEWRASFCRHVATGGKEFSAWAKLGTAAFQNTKFFGKIIFRKNSVIADRIRLSPSGMFCRLRNLTGTEQQVTCAMVKHTTMEASVQAKKIISLAPGETTETDVEGKFESDTLLWSEIRQGESTLLAKHCSQAQGEYIRFQIFDPENVRGNVNYLAVDHPFFIAWNMHHNLPCKHPQGNINRQHDAVDFIMEVPEGLAFSGVMHDASAYQWKQSKLVPPKAEPFEKDGRKWQRLRFELPCVTNWNEPNFLFFYTCSLSEGKAFQAPCWFERKGKVFSRTVKEFKTISVGKVRVPFARIPFNVGLMDALTLRTWLPVNTLENYRALGFNCLSIPIEKCANQEFYSGNAPVTREDHFDLLYQEIQQKKLPFFMNTLEISTGFPAHAWTRKESEMVGLKKDGTYGTNSEYGAPPLCFTYRGKHYQEWIDSFLNSSAFDKYKVTWLALDMELWRKSMFDEICYCDRCLKAFRKFCQQHSWTALAELDPKTADSPEFKKAWLTFQTSMATDFVSSMADAVRAKAKDYPQTNPWGKFTVQDYGSPSPVYIKESMDFYAVSLYSTPDGVYHKFHDLHTEHGLNSRIFGCWLAYGQTCGCPDWQLTAEQLKENIFEVCIFGTKSIVYYYNIFLEPLRMKYIVQALNAMVPMENIITDGKITKDTNSGSEPFLLTLRELGDEGILALRTYSARPDFVCGKVSIPAAKTKRQIYDCDSGELVAELAPGESSFSYEMPRQRCHILYIGTTAQWEKRHL